MEISRNASGWLSVLGFTFFFFSVLETHKPQPKRPNLQNKPNTTTQKKSNLPNFRHIYSTDLRFTNDLLKKHVFKCERAAMRRSKLEFYEDILIALATKPLTIDALAYKCKMNCVVLNKRLEFLLKNGLVEEETRSNNKRHYELTQRGTAIYKTLRIAKRLEKLQTTANQTMQAFPVLPKHDERKTTRIR